ncbi:hypothetical protein JEOAER750_01282 [Jeotgalicoccus aerolatus]|uniref:Uncharacterized protein n=1 Tax=Jeotgalicoccus aerolatus TaxID=709510 RepID=A0A1G8UIL8_9STAP|nr:hypothetical protein [Jeotgalicoccus aerolatus]CAD2075736.1 hypothetical protein JEOAER750_01282 [Jeotgalicoccus aerolatus]SDJ53599.1 hypothetical protein SAMN05216187_10112 [Jeotgalicoccus aerolatus]
MLFLMILSIVITVIIGFVVFTETDTEDSEIIE